MILRHVLFSILFAISLPAQSQPDQGKVTSKPEAKTQADKSPSKQPPQVINSTKADPPKTSGAQDANKGDTQLDMLRETNRIAEFTLWLALATGVLGLAAIAQAVIARNSSQRQLRAYVWEQVNVQELHSTRDSYLVQVRIRNSGATPAYDVHSWGLLALIDDAEAAGHAFPPPSASAMANDPRYVVNPGGSYTMGVQIVGQSQENMRKRLYLWGEIRYRDAFKKNRSTKFRMFLRDDGTSRIWAYCHQGNEAK